MIFFFFYVNPLSVVSLMWFYNAFPGHALLLHTFWREATRENVKIFRWNFNASQLLHWIFCITLFLCFVWQVGAMIGASSVNLKLILTEQTIAGFLFHQWTLFRGCLILVEILGMGDKRMLMSWWGQQLFFVGVSLVVEFLSISQLMRLKFIWFRFVIDMMQSVCLDEFGGEKVVPPRAQETTLIQYIFGGLLQSQVLFPYLSRRSCAVFANTNNTMMYY